MNEQASGPRYHLTLTSGGRPMMHGWWESEAVARAQVSVWIGSWGELPGARVTLDDEETGATLTSWPGVVSGEQ